MGTTSTLPTSLQTCKKSSRKIYQEDIRRDTFMVQLDLEFPSPGYETLNELSYCEKHGRDVCSECHTDMRHGNENEFEIPEGGPQYPRVLQSIRDKDLRKHLGARWLAMQKEMYGRRPASRILLTQADIPELLSKLLSSPKAVQGTLIRIFRQLKVQISTQRYHFANQARIMIDDYDNFVEGAVMDQHEGLNLLVRFMSVLHLNGFGGDSTCCQQAMSRRSKANVLDAFGFFLELKTERTFWQAMENTFDALISHVERFDDEKDHGAVMTDKAKDGYLQCVAHFFWAVRHAQFRLNRLRVIQLEVFQRETFPFFSYSRKALEGNADVDLLITKLSKTPVHDVPRFAKLIANFNYASNYFEEQMTGVNVQLMAAIDSLSTKFRILQKLVMAAFLIASPREIKSAIATYKFNSNGVEVNSQADDVEFIQTLTNIRRDPVPKKLSFLQKLIVKENQFRQENAKKIVRPPYSIDHSFGFSKGVFKAFRTNFLDMYERSIRKEWKEDESSLIGPDIAGRFHHRQDVGKAKRKGRPLAKEDEEAAELKKIRLVPEEAFVDPSLFWEIGDGSVEKYVPPVIREKIKSHKLGTPAEGEQRDGSVAVNEAASGVDPGTSGVLAEEEEAIPPNVRRSLDQLKRADLDTRDLLWGKVKGTLKWSQLVQFLSRLGCEILNLDGSKRKIVDTTTGRCAVLHKPHPADKCRPDQLASYRVHIEDWLEINYSDVVLPTVG